MPNRSIALIAALFLFTAFTYAAEPFPTLETENLLSRKVVLPDAVKGRPAVLVIGFTHGSQAQMKAWAARLEPNVEPWTIAVLEDAPRLVRPMAISGMKSGVAQNQRQRYLVLTRHEKELKAAVSPPTDAAPADGKPDDAYIVLLDRDGAINWRFHGAFTDSAVEDLQTRLAALTAPR